VARWVSADDHLDDWTQQFFAAGAERSGFLAFPNANPDWIFPAWQAPAPAVNLPAPEVTVIEDLVSGDQRTLRFRLTSPRGAPNVYLDVKAPGTIEATLDGKPLDLTLVPNDLRARLRLVYHAVPAEGIDVGLTFPAAGPVSIRVEDRSNGLPKIPGVVIAPRPDDTMPAPFEMADPTIVTHSIILAPK
jgi:hypothetical protein